MRPGHRLGANVLKPGGHLGKGRAVPRSSHWPRCSWTQDRTGGTAAMHHLKPPSRLPLAFSHLSPTAANGTRTAEPWSCHFLDLLADLAGKKKKTTNQPQTVTSCTQIQEPSQPWSCECPSCHVPGPREARSHGGAAPGHPARPPAPPRERGSGAACTHAPGRHAVPGLGTTRSSARAPHACPPRWAVAEPARGSAKLLTAFSNTCSFMKTITLARSKHIQTNLLYDTRGCQRNGEKPLLIHSAVPAQPRRGKRPAGAPSATGHPGVAGTPAAGAESGIRGYLAVTFIHISAFRGKNKRFLPNQQANLMQKGRAPACSPWLQHPLPALSAGQASSPGIVRVMSVGSPGAATPAPREALGVLGSASCWGCPLHPLAPSCWDSEGTRG